MSKTQDSIELTEEGLKKVQQRMSELEKPFDPDNKQGWSQEDLAQDSNTSVSTVKRFLNRKPITRQRIIKLTAALGIDPEEVVDLKVWNRTTATSQSTRKSDIDWQEVCRAMLEPKRELASNLFTSGMGIKFELDDIHVPLGLVERPQKVQRCDDSSPEEGSRVYREEKEKITPIDYDDFFQQVLANQQSPKSNGKHLNIIGEPGAGKTTQLLKIADWVLDETEDLPIWISLGVVGEKPLQEYLLKDWLRDAAGKLDAAPPAWVEQLEQHLKDGRVWLLLDGADEMQVADPLGKLAEFLRVPLLKNVRVVLTCRLNLWDAAGNALSEFDTYKMLDFSYGDGNNPDQVKQFIDKWFGNPSPALPYKEREQEAFPHVGGTEGGEQLRKALDEIGKERIKDLARHPLRLALLCFTWQCGQGKLPDTKAELYEMFVEALYVLKKGVFPTTSAQQRDLNAALGRLALQAIDEGFKSILPHSLVDEGLKKPHPELFELAGKLGWLNQVGVEPENPLKPVYAFFHPTFQEYFAATVINDWDFFLNHISDNPKDTKASYRIFEPQWKEVILLWLGRKDLQHHKKEKFIKALVEFQDKCSELYQEQALFLAASGLAEFSKCSLVPKILLEITFSGFGIFDSKNKKWTTFPTVAEEAKAALRETHRQSAISVLEYLLNTIACDELCLEIALYLGENFVVNQKIIEIIIQLMSHSRRRISRQRREDIIQNPRCRFMKIAIGNPKVIAILIHIIKISQNNKNKQIYSSLLYEIGNEGTEGVALLKRWLHKSADEKIRFLLSDILQKIKANKSRSSFTYKITPKTPEAVANLVHEAKDEEICCKAIRELSFYWGNSDAIKKTLTEILYSTKNEQIRYHAASSLQFIEPANPLASSTFTELIYTTQNSTILKNVIEDLYSEENLQLLIYAIAKLIRISQSSEEISSSILGEIFEFEIGVCNPDIIDALTEKLRSSEDEALRSSLAFKLAVANPGNPEAFHTLISTLLTTQDDDLVEDLIVGIRELYQENDEQMISLTELLHKSYNEVTRWRLAAILIRYQPSRLEAVIILTETLNKTKDKNIHFALIENSPEDGESEWIDSLVYLLCNSQDSLLCEQAAWNLKRILISSKFPSVVTALRNCEQEHINEDRHDCSLYCEGILWHCAQNMSYADFYEAWHRQSTTTHPEAPDNIPVGNSTEAQTLEAQNLDFHRLQPTEHTYPLAINLLSLKEETEEGAIAQKLCTKIYKHQAVKIPGKPPTVKSDAELQQHLFEIQEKLQRLNLALVLYIKDTNGFHEPIEEAIAFCQKLADPDLGVHIAWITNQHLEPPLKNILPDLSKLITKVQSWIDEIV